MLDEKIPTIVEVAGRSMEPTLPMGAKVMVRPIENHLETFDVVLIRGSACWIVHRVVHTDVVGRRVYHRGDGEGGVGVCPLDAVVGIIRAGVYPGDLTFSSRSRFSPDFLRRFDQLAARCRLHARLSCLADRIGLGTTARARLHLRSLRRLVLGG